MELKQKEHLMMEVLAARYRSGEAAWTFDSVFKKVAESLAKRGLVSWKYAVIEEHILVSLTEKGIEEWLAKAYSPPYVFCLRIPVFPPDHYFVAEHPDIETMFHYDVVKCTNSYLKDGKGKWYITRLGSKKLYNFRNGDFLYSDFDEELHTAYFHEALTAAKSMAIEDRMKAEKAGNPLKAGI